ncbi:free fatty acid receptor 3 [Polymixia lowei]
MYENITLLCGEDPLYYTSIAGIVVDWVVFFIGLPLVCMAGYALLTLLRRDRAAPVFAINLLLSDLLQISITLVFIVSRFFDKAFQPFVEACCISRLFVRLGICASLGFMFLISVERYLLVAYPVWYRTRNNAKFPILVAICLWTLSLTYAALDYVFLIHTRFSLLLFSFISLIPGPFLLGFLIATWKVLRKSMTYRQGRKMRSVIGPLSLVLGIYTVLFLPFSFRNLYYLLKNDSETNRQDLSSVLTSALIYLSPLTDPFIYIFMRKDIKDTMDAFPCCKKLLVKECDPSVLKVKSTSQSGAKYSVQYPTRI